MKNDMVKAGKQRGITLVEEGRKTGTVALGLGREAVETNTFQDAAKGAAAGAVIAVPVPLIGPLTGAIVGAAAGVIAGRKLRTGAGSGNSAAAGRS